MATYPPPVFLQLEKLPVGTVTIPQNELTAAFPVPWDFLLGWWIWGLSYLLTIDGTAAIAPTSYGTAALLVCFFVRYVASLPMSDAVMHRLTDKKKKVSSGRVRPPESFRSTAGG